MAADAPMPLGMTVTVEETPYDLDDPTTSKLDADHQGFTTTRPCRTLKDVLFSIFTVAMVITYVCLVIHDDLSLIQTLFFLVVWVIQWLVIFVMTYSAFDDANQEYRKRYNLVVVNAWFC
ncbi:hypothetical protein OsI_25330 [Oryza sativa Indica Group]|uniref:Uncharacterized protein n=2 Tax=Oryza sativa TaxID=4530 RepID=Q69VX7_ORYSJ|nr:hypothetical protein OsI_25330 [Oryza sativa Indica Group]EAZ39076.1 hypothetical protein OsJ_23508 [Oryza sativa Japonica Group]BAC57272.1 hypothetical protein [Oryza sativa Japonica Group]BAD30432.1 hypothetical protein [Oryza sativa Japonica Group]